MGAPDAGGGEDAAVPDLAGADATRVTLSGTFLLTLDAGAFPPTTAHPSALVYLPGLPTWALGAFCFATGFLASSQIVCFALAKENHPPGRSGTAISFVNALGTGAGALFQPLIGFLLDLAWAGGVSQGARVYDTSAYSLAFASLVVFGIVGLLCLLAVRETFCKPVEATDHAR